MALPAQQPATLLMQNAGQSFTFEDFLKSLAAQQQQGIGPAPSPVDVPPGPPMLRHVPFREAGRPERPGFGRSRALGSERDDWPESRSLECLSNGVRVKGSRLARMADGIMDGAAPHLFRVHSTSGAAEFWPVDMAACLCACPNDQAVCSHIFGVCVAYPRYRIKMATLIKARELVAWAARSSRSPDEVVAQLAGCLERWLAAARAERAGKAGQEGEGAAAEMSRVCAEVVVALLLQGAVESEDVYGPGRRGGPRRVLWWRQATSALLAPGVHPCTSLDAPPPSRTSQLAELRVALAYLLGRLEKATADQRATAEDGAPVRGDAMPGGASGVSTPSTALAASRGPGMVGAIAEPAAAASKPVAAGSGAQRPSADVVTQGPLPRSVRELLLTLEDAVTRALHLDELPPPPPAAPLVSEVSAARRTALDAAAAAKGAAVPGAPAAARGLGVGGLLPLLAEADAEVHDMFERACNLVVGLRDAEGRQEAQQQERERERVKQNDSSGQPAPGAETIEPQQPQAQPPTAAASAEAEAVAAAANAGGASDPAAAQLAAVAAQKGTTPSGPGSPLLASHLVAFCRQAVVAAEAAAAAAADALAEPGHPGQGLEDAGSLPLAAGPEPERAALLAAVEAAACRQFGAASFRDLTTHGSVEELLAAAADGDDDGIGTCGGAPLFLQALLAGGGGAGDAASGAAAVGAGMDREDEEVELTAMLDAALPAERTVPGRNPTARSGGEAVMPLEVLGPLAAGGVGAGFSGAAAASVLALRGAAAGPTAVLALPGGLGLGGALAVDPAASSSSFAEALARLDGPSAVRSLLGLLAGAGGLGALPLQLLRARAEAAVAEALDSGAETTTHPASQAGAAGEDALVRRLGSYCLGVALTLPAALLRCGVLLQLLLPPRLRAAIEPNGGAGPEEGGGSAAVDAAERAAGLPEPLRCGALAALWRLGRHAGCGSLQRGAESRLRRLVAPPRPALGSTLTPGAAAGEEAVEGGRRSNADGGDDGEDEIVLVPPQRRPPSGSACSAVPASEPHVLLSAGLQPPVPGAAADSAGGSAAAAEGDAASVPRAGSGDGGGGALAGALPAWRLRGRVSVERAREVLESIRQKEFGVGLAAPPELLAVLSAQSRRLQRSLARLAAELYGSPGHLLLELVQNADDCRYPPELASFGEEPTLALRLGPTGLALGCNEIGFSEADVRALCDVGASSKAAKPHPPVPSPEATAQPPPKAGIAASATPRDAVPPQQERQQTGEKGIGFKSVFAISDAPAIHSNGFSFGFDAQDPSGLGYVLPQHKSLQTAQAGEPGLPQPQPPPPPASGWGTVLLLPAAPRLLQPEGANGPQASGPPGPPGAGPPAPGAPRWRDLASGLLDFLGPGLLLFLRRLRVLVLHDELGGVVHTLRREDREGGAVVQVTWRVDALAPSTAGGAAPSGRGAPLRESVHVWVVGGTTLAPPLVTRGSGPGAVRPPSATVKVALPLPPKVNATAATGAAAAGAGTNGANGDGDVDRVAGPRGLGPLEHCCQVFATLPLRPSGLPFDLQADWMVPSSREDISSGEAWNQMLRDQVPAAFLSAVRTGTGLVPALRRGGWLRYVPHAGGSGGRAGSALGGAVLPFLRSVLAATAAALRATPCLAPAPAGASAAAGGVDGQAAGGPEGELLLPSQVAVGASQSLRRLLPPWALRAATGLAYADTSGLAELGLEEARAAAGLAATGDGSELGQTSGDADGGGEEDGAGAAVDPELLPPPGVLAALGLPAFSAHHAVASLQALSGADAASGGRGGGMQRLTGDLEAAGGSWRWALLGALEELLEEQELQHSHAAGPRAAAAAPTLGRGPAGPSLSALVAELRSLPLVPLLGGRLAPAAEALMPSVEVAAVEAANEGGPEPGGRASATAGGGSGGLTAKTVPSAAAVAAAAVEAPPPSRRRRRQGVSLLGEGGYVYGFEAELPLVDLEGLHAATRDAPALRARVLRCLTRLGVAPLAPADVINRHVLPALRRAQQQAAAAAAAAQSLPMAQGQTAAAAESAQQVVAVVEAEPGNGTPGGCDGLHPAALVGYAAYLLHHTHLAARDPRVAQEWAEALVWVLVPPEAVEAAPNTRQSQRARKPAAAAPATADEASEDATAADGSSARRNASRRRRPAAGSKPTDGPDGSAARATTTATDGPDQPTPPLSAPPDPSSAPPAGWAAVPSAKGVCLGLSFPQLAASRAAAAGPAGPALGDALEALRSALSRRRVPAVLWAEGYLRFGSAAQWAEFCGPGLLGCGFTLARLEGRPAPARGPSTPAPATAAAAAGAEWHSTDLEAVLEFLGAAATSGSGDAVAAATAVGPSMPRLRSLAVALDSLWSAEYEGRAWGGAGAGAGGPHKVVPAPERPGSAAPAAARTRRPAPFLSMLRSRPWLPDSWAGCGAPAGSGSTDSGVESDLEKPGLPGGGGADGLGMLAAGGALRALLGPAGRYAGVQLNDPRFICALGLLTAPSPAIALRQLKLWQRAAAGAAAAAASAETAAAVVPSADDRVAELAAASGPPAHDAEQGDAQGSTEGGQNAAVGRLSQPRPAAGAPTPAALPQPTVSDLAGVYRYLASQLAAEAPGATEDGEAEEEADTATGADAGAEQSRAAAGSGALAAQISAVFASVPLIAVPEADAPLCSMRRGAASSGAAAVAAVERGGRRQGDRTAATRGTRDAVGAAAGSAPRLRLRWCTPREVVWSMGPLQARPDAAAVEAAASETEAEAEGLALLPARVAEHYPPALRSFFVRSLGVAPHPGLEHILSACRRAAAAGTVAGPAAAAAAEPGFVPAGSPPALEHKPAPAPAPALAALACLGWLGRLLEPLTGTTITPPEAASSARGGAGGAESSSDISPAAAVVGGGAHESAAGAVLAALRREALIPTVDSRWVTADGGQSTGARPCRRLLVSADWLVPGLAGAEPVQGVAVAAGQEAVAAAAAEARRGAGAVTEPAVDSAGALPGLLAAARAAGRTLDVVGAPAAPAESRASAAGSLLQLQLAVGSGADGESSGWYGMAGTGSAVAVAPVGASCQGVVGAACLSRSTGDDTELRRSLAFTATRVLGRLNDVLPFLVRWAASAGGGATWRRQERAAAAAVGWLRLAAVVGGLGLVHCLPLLDITSEPQPVRAVLFPRNCANGGNSQDAPCGAEGTEVAAAGEAAHEAVCRTVLYVRCDGSSSGLDAEDWRAVFEEAARLLFGGVAPPEAVRLALLVHTLMEAGQVGEALEASVAALHGGLPRAQATAKEEQDAAEGGGEGAAGQQPCFGASWERLRERELEQQREREVELERQRVKDAEASLSLLPSGQQQRAREAADDAGDGDSDGDQRGQRGVGAAGRAEREGFADGDGSEGAWTAGEEPSSAGRDGQQAATERFGADADRGEDGRQGSATRAGAGGDGAGGDGGAGDAANVRNGELGEGRRHEGPHYGDDADYGGGPPGGEAAYRSPGRPMGLGALAQWTASDASYSQDVVDVGADVHRSLAGALQLPVAPEDAPRAAREAVGRWGEQYVAGLLRATAGPGEVVEWVNARDEQCQPYDVVVRQEDTGEVVAFVEVKATSSWDKTYFEVSHREWLFAQQEGSRYHIYRLFGAGQPAGHAQEQAGQPRVVRIVNPYMQWRSQRVGICLAL
ncbi:hypothetical protein GPECTOR_8g248 [Gonium pectorale]|uniref:Protein NO VEIN C-terminal domain-containing protein n=1 Tax=Gonium pectorale TaxID=33097 RepID=A0A150GSN4_GONPE|nr:hypothetical protein GPECTOR_8g248 [Gonium pectorale]|eukprot:KXZ52866.1 hypothetical protein GPECTOR_8g248 [Gonium pectorale]